MADTQNQPSFHTQKTLAKLARRMARLVIGAGLTYDQWRETNKMVRKMARLAPTRRRKALPRVPTADNLRAIFAAVDKGGNVQHGMILRTLFFTGCRVQELANLQTDDVDLDAGRIRVSRGKGDKDRYTLIPHTFRVALRAYMAGVKGPDLFAGRQGPYTTRRLAQIVGRYASEAGVECSPHSFRHALVTILTAAGLTDSQLLPLTGHADKRTLAVYQHVGIGPETRAAYEAAMRGVAV